MIEFTA